MMLRSAVLRSCGITTIGKSRPVVALHPLKQVDPLASSSNTATSLRCKSSVASFSSSSPQETKGIEGQPTLVKVPSIPLAGSLWQRHSQIPVEFAPDRVFDFWPAMRAKYGDFYEVGIPGFGVGLNGICYVIQDPHEMASVLRAEGEYPTGATEFAWAFGKFFNERNMSVGGLVGHGPKWKRIRRFVQSDLLSPQAAQRYVPAILEAAASASKGAPSFAAQNKLNEYLNLASFDMFTNVMFGSLPHVSDPGSSTSDPDDRKLCTAVAQALRISSAMTYSVQEFILNNVFNIKTKQYKEFEFNWDLAQQIAQRKTEDVYRRRAMNQLSEREQDSYANLALTRQENPETNDQNDKDTFVTMHEAKAVVGVLISAGVDTAGGMLSFKLLHLASSPEVQDKLYHELQPTLVDGKLTRESLAIPYLTAILRESHRLANANVMIPMKRLPTDRPVHGYDLPRGSVIVLDTYSVGMDQNHFEIDMPVTEFLPERFSQEAVQSRKGTRHQVVDHSFFSGPFSQGARKCPGSRVANLEAHALLAQWVLDYTMELPSSIHHFLEVPYGLDTVTTCKLPQIQFTPRL